jgi:hypothetical protein
MQGYVFNWFSIKHFKASEVLGDDLFLILMSIHRAHRLIEDMLICKATLVFLKLLKYV